MKTAQQYRALAREQLGGQLFGNTWIYGVLIALIYSAVFSLLSATGFGIIIAFLVEGFLTVGISVIYLKLAHGSREVDFNDLFAAKDRIGNALLLGLMKNLFTALWTLLFVVPGIIKAYAYSQAYYLSAEHDNWDWKMCLDESQKMMRGNKWRLFCLDLSFIGWWIVGALCLGVGTLWVMPYCTAARTNFHEDLLMTPVVE